MWQTARSILKRDPAAHSLAQVILTYPGLHALFWHRIAHFCARYHRYVLAGLVSRWSAMTTGISIDPEAVIGHRVFIDHGVGVVIGATAIVEDDVTILHGVTLGARYPTDVGRRHPVVKHGAFLGADALILGAITIGEGAKIGAGAVVLRDVAPHTTAVGNPARPLQSASRKVLTFRQLS